MDHFRGVNISPENVHLINRNGPFTVQSGASKSFIIQISIALSIEGR